MNDIITMTDEQRAEFQKSSLHFGLKATLLKSEIREHEKAVARAEAEVARCKTSFEDLAGRIDAEATERKAAARVPLGRAEEALAAALAVVEAKHAEVKEAEKAEAAALKAEKG